LIGGDIGCGWVFKTASFVAAPKLDRWAQPAVQSRTPVDQFSSDFLAERDLESTEFDSALARSAAAIHFAELQTVEKVLEADEFKKTWPRQESS